jgi:polysaccharide chain length determinant protein (PEP-CTERM system associated)
MIPGKRYTPETLWHIFLRRKWVILVPFVLIAAATALVAQRLPNRYRSETLILAVPQQVPSNYVQPTVTTRLEERLMSINQQILSRTRLEQIVLEFDLYTDERQTAIMEDVIERMRTRDISVQISAGGPRARQATAPTVRIAFAGNDARTAQRVTERLASFFIEENLRDRAALAEGTNQFLEVQLQDARNRLIEQEKRLEAYRQKFAGQLPSQLDANLQRIQTIQLQLQALAQSVNQDGERRLMLDRLLAEAEATPPILAVPTVPPVVRGESAAAPLTALQQLEEARAQLRALELRLKPAHPDLTRMRRAIAELERKADAEALQQPVSPPVVEGGSPAATITPEELQRQARIREMRTEREMLDRRIAGKEAEEKRLQEVLTGYQERVATIPVRETELAELTRDYETLRQIYTNLLSKSENARAAADLERRQIGEQFKVLDPARLPQRPISPNRPQINAVGALGGIAVGLGLLLLLEYRDRSLRTEEDVLGVLALPVLAVVPRMVSLGERPRLVLRRRLVRFAVAATVLLVVVGSAMIAWRIGLVGRWAELGSEYVGLVLR